MNNGIRIIPNRYTKEILNSSKKIVNNYKRFLKYIRFLGDDNNMPTIQELIDEYARSKNPDFYKKIIKSVQTSNKLWAAYSPVTKNTYIEYFNGKPSAFIFSEKTFCEAFKEHLAVHKTEIETELCKPETRIQFFSDLFRCGVENIVLDNGKQFISMDIFDIIDKPDFSSLPKTERQL